MDNSRNNNGVECVEKLKYPFINSGLDVLKTCWRIVLDMNIMNSVEYELNY